MNPMTGLPNDRSEAPRQAGAADAPNIDASAAPAVGERFFTTLERFDRRGHRQAANPA
ncbi:MAG: hypothetical protein ACLTSX_09780 [Collinsella sp.]